MIALRKITLVGLLAAAACSSRDEDPTADTAKKDDMAGMDMPGMDMGGKPYTARSGAMLNEVRLSAEQIRHGSIAWQAVNMETVAATVTVPGQIVPNEDRTARLGAPAGGRIIAVRVRPGDRVARGQLLVTMQSPEAGAAQSDLAKAQAGVASARAEVAYAKSARDRAERLLTLKAIPRQEYERAVADAELAQSALAQAEAELTRARSSAAQLGAAASASGEIALRAPLAGVVLTRSAVPGTVVETGAPLVIVTDPRTLWLTIDAPESLSGAFRVGGTLRFSVQAYAGESFTARVDAIGAGLDPNTRTLPVRATVDNRRARLKPEMLATVTAEGGRLVAAATLPDESVQLLNTKTVVFIVRPDAAGSARFVWREVEVGSRTRGRVAVTRGLNAGDIVVTTGAFAVKAEFQKGAMPKMEM